MIGLLVLVSTAMASAPLPAPLALTYSNQGRPQRLTSGIDQVLTELQSAAEANPDNSALRDLVTFYKVQKRLIAEERYPRTLAQMEKIAEVDMKLVPGLIAWLETAPPETQADKEKRRDMILFLVQRGQVFLEAAHFLRRDTLIEMRSPARSSAVMFTLYTLPVAAALAVVIAGETLINRGLIPPAYRSSLPLTSLVSGLLGVGGTAWLYKLGQGLELKTETNRLTRQMEGDLAHFSGGRWSNEEFERLLNGWSNELIRLELELSGCEVELAFFKAAGPAVAASGAQGASPSPRPPD